MSIRDERDELHAQHLDNKYIHAVNSIFYTEANKWTKLSEVRGKVVPVNRYSNNGGLKWNDKEIFKIQDKYKLSELSLGYRKAVRIKIGKVKEHIYKAKKTNDKKYYINFASAHCCGCMNKKTSIKVNSAVKKIYNKLNRKNIHAKGIILMDYPDLTKGVISSIIKNNKHIPIE